LLVNEEDQAKKFYISYLNNLRCLIRIFNNLIPKAAFILLPGDEIVEKKH
jgi:hypothetical protein